MVNHGYLWLSMVTHGYPWSTMDMGQSQIEAVHHRERGLEKPMCVHKITRWYGMVWYGMPWYGMPWLVMVWYAMVWHAMARYGIVWHGMAWYSIVLYDMVWQSMVWHGMARRRYIKDRRCEVVGQRYEIWNPM